MRKRVCRGIFVLMMMILMTATAFAADTQRASDRFNSYTANLYVVSNGDLDINFSVTASSTMDILGASRIVVERDNGYRWVTECTLTANNIPAMQTSNATQYSASIPYEPIDPNAHYRAVVTFYAKDSSGSSTVQATTK